MRKGIVAPLVTSHVFACRSASKAKLNGPGLNLNFMDEVAFTPNDET